MSGTNDNTRRDEAATPAHEDVRWDEIDAPEITTREVLPAGNSRKSQRTKIAGAVLLGGIAGAAILGPLGTMAASPSPAAPAASGAPTATSDPSEATETHGGGPGGHVEAATDTSVVAKAIGISEADLKTALAGGQTVAAVAKAHNVDIQTVIDALVADGQSELDAAVKAGTITQAQADAQKANLTQRATDQANDTFGGGTH
ncbi:MAG TPA: hypothetical protein VGC90_01700 [Candidatus Limnocylindrales bacterium]